MQARRIICLAALLTAVTLVPAWAQPGRVAGTVKDEDGRAIRGATILADNPNSSPSSFTATTDDKGRYAIIGLRSGFWRVTAYAPGFAPVQFRMRVRTSVNSPRVDFKLAIGATGKSGSAFDRVDVDDLQDDLEKADALFESGDYDEAIERYERVILAVPTLTAVQLKIGSAYQQKKDYDKAIAAYQAILRVDPVNEKAEVAIGMVQLEKGDLEAAEATLSPPAERAHASGEACYYLGQVKERQGQSEQAVSWYERAHTMYPQWGEPLLKLGAMALNGGDRTKAAGYLDRLLEVDPNSTAANEARTLLEQLNR